MVWQALILYKIAWNFNMLLVITISNSLGKIIQFEPSLYIKPLVAIAYFVIPTLSGVICCGGKQRKLARKNFALWCGYKLCFCHFLLNGPLAKNVKQSAFIVYD